MKNWLRKCYYDRIASRNRQNDEKIVEDAGLSEFFAKEYDTKTGGSGDHSYLFEYIKEHRPRRVIEFGSGKSTWIIAKAMEMYCWDKYEGNIELVSMEHHEGWYNKHISNLPNMKIDHFDEFVSMILSPIEEFRHRFIVGLVYSDMPMRQFDFCFVDGVPPEDLCGMDLIKLLTVSSEPISCLIDGRRTTQTAYAALLGTKKMTRYHTGLCLFDKVTADDLADAGYKKIYRQLFPEKTTILRF
jgi:hypothetical protein